MKIVGHHADAAAFAARETHRHAHHVEWIDDGSGGCWFVVFPRDVTMREWLGREATIFPTAQNPNPIAPEHVAKLAPHGVVATDSHWVAHEKLAASLSHRLFHPDV
jgi:hypothetical protein